MADVTKIYRGIAPRTVRVLELNGDHWKARELALRRDLRDHSSGFSWGYAGQGPTQLALAILADAIGPEDALRLYQLFKFRVIGPLPFDGGWELSLPDVLEHVRRIELDELRYQCRNRARSQLVRASWPMTPDQHEENIAMIRLHTGAPAHVAEGVYNEVLAELQEEMERAAEEAGGNLEEAER